MKRAELTRIGAAEPDLGVREERPDILHCSEDSAVQAENWKDDAAKRPAGERFTKRAPAKVKYTEPDSGALVGAAEDTTALSKEKGLVIVVGDMLCTAVNANAISRPLFLTEDLK